MSARVNGANIADLVEKRNHPWTVSIESELKATALAAVRIRKLNISRELQILYRRDKHLSRAARAFIEIANEER